MTDLADEIRQFCIIHHLRLNTDLGQHFLIDHESLDAIVDAAGIKEGDHIVEIGPGIGVLTRELLKRAKKVTAIEVDERLIPLTKKFTEGLNEQLEVIQGNALKVPLPESPYKIVANIPYHITSPLLRHACIESPVRPTSLTLLIQKEVAEKICTQKDRSLLSIIVQIFGEPRIVKNVPPGSFLPPPKVDSAVLHIDCFDESKASGETLEEIFKLTKLAFSQKRKMISNSIGKMEGGMERLEKAGIDPNRRPQTLSVEEWITLATS